MSTTTMTDAGSNATTAQKAIFYHAGCPVCVSAEEGVARALDPAAYTVEVVHLGNDTARVTEAEAKGVTSVPALVIGDAVFHINYGAPLDALK